MRSMTAGTDPRERQVGRRVRVELASGHPRRQRLELASADQRLDPAQEQGRDQIAQSPRGAGAAAAFDLVAARLAEPIDGVGQRVDADAAGRLRAKYPREARTPTGAC